MKRFESMIFPVSRRLPSFLRILKGWMSFDPSSRSTA